MSGGNSIINQTSKTGIINWGNFSIASGESVQFNNGAGATLNRVTITGSVSSIAGSLNATGSVYLINQNGIIVTPTGNVVTGGSFVASTRDVSNAAFRQGAVLEFTGTSSGTVTNQGHITAGANAVLIGKSAENDGIIGATNGAVLAGDDVVLQPMGTNLQIQVRVTSGATTNTGSISAAQAMLNAAGGNVYALAGNDGGLINATSTANIGGHVWLVGTGTAANPVGVTVAGNVNASGGITISGTGYDGVSPQSAFGVEITGAVVGGGPITINGKGGNRGVTGIAPGASNPLDPCVAGICNYGVFVNGGAVLGTGTAPVTIIGTGGGAGGDTFGNDGVFNGGGLIQGNGGPVTIVGIGGASTGSDNFGITNEGMIANAGNGSITLAGVSGANGAGAEASPLGVGQVGVANLGLVEAGTGDISVTGAVGPNATGFGNFGIAIGAGAISTGGNGKITLTGVSNGAGMDAGVFLVNFLGAMGMPAPVVSAADGQIRITGVDLSGPASVSNASVLVTAGSISSGSKIKIDGEGAPVVNYGSITAAGQGAAVIIHAPQGFMNFGTITTPNGTAQTDNQED
jgi:filamentous hemagglutinin family protein